MQWSKMLGLELQPFSVRVFSLITGSTATKVISHGDLSLLETSHYRKGIAEVWKQGASEDVQTKSALAEAEYAKDVVRTVLGGASGPAWRGASTSMVNFMYRFVPTALLVSRPL
jgi:short-subunit dehydrogenase